MEKELRLSKQSYSLFLRAMIGFPIVGFLVATYIVTKSYGAHTNVLWSFPYAALYYWDQPSKIIIYCYIIMLASFFFPLFFITPGNKTSDKYGKAKYATKEHIKKMNLHSKTGIILGKEKNTENSNLFRYDKPLSMLVLAPPGTGKTSCIGIPNVLGLDEHSLVIHDPKGELANNTIQYRKKISKVSLFNFAEEGAAVFNPLCKTMLPEKDSHLQSYIDNIATIIFDKNVKKSDSYWDDEAANLFRFIALFLIWQNGETSLPEIFSATKKMTSLKDVIREKTDILSEGPTRKSPPTGELFSEEEYEEPPPVPDPLKEKVFELGNSLLQIVSSDNQTAGVAGAFNSKMSIFSDDVIANNTTGKNQLPLRIMRKELHTIYIVVEEKDRDRLRPIVTLLLEALTKDLISELPKPGDHRITFILDEFVRLRGIDTLKTLPEISRGYNLSAIFIAQDYKQVENVFGAEMTDMLETLCAYKVIFKQNNAKTAQRASELIGKYTDTRISTSSSDDPASNRKSKSESEEGLHLITAQDILNLEMGKIIILAEGFAKHPILAYSALDEKTQPFKDILKNNQVDDYKNYLGEDNA